MTGLLKMAIVDILPGPVKKGPGLDEWGSIGIHKRKGTHDLNSNGRQQFLNSAGRHFEKNNQRL